MTPSISSPSPTQQPDARPVPEQAQVDLQKLAEEIVALMKHDLRIDRERGSPVNFHPGTPRVSR
ncbi:MAG TPA: hypothetical protein VIO61_07305 [Anaerolineaceae bacterium]